MLTAFLPISCAALLFGGAELQVGGADFDLRGGLLVGRLERSRIDVEQQVALFHLRAILETNLIEIAGDAGADTRPTRRPRCGR